MSPTDPYAVDPAEAILARLAGLDLSMAQHVHACAMGTNEVREVTEIAKAYQRVSRCVRQSVALHARLKHEREAAEQAGSTPSTSPPPASPSHPPPDRPDAPGLGPNGLGPNGARLDVARVVRRRAEVRDAVCRVIWNETESEGDDSETLLDSLEDCLNLRTRHADFYDVRLDDQVADVCAALGLPTETAQRWRDLPRRPLGPGDGFDDPDDLHAHRDDPRPDPGAPQPPIQNSA
ncbi:MAG: hypothetical protein U1C74_23905 [Phenylobacterium sp.]|nr:hypothetical protein [Phenylobacterium sp.]